MATTALRRSTLFVFALPALMQGFLHAPALNILQGVYAKEAGLALAALGTGMLVARLLDALTDPLIGVLSDAWHRRTGTRKPFVLAGAVITAMGLWFLFQPPADVSILWLVGWLVVADIGWTMTEIPYRAWSYELSSAHVERTRIQSWIGVALMAGAFSFFVVPILGKSLGLTDSTAIDLQSLGLTAWVIAALCPAFTLLAVWRVPDGSAALEPNRRVPLRELWVAVRGNVPLLYFILAFFGISFFSSLGQGISFLYANTYLGLGERYAVMMLALLPAMLIGIPFWAWLGTRIERHKAWAIASAFSAVTFGATGLAEPGPDALLMYALPSVGGMFGLAALAVLPTAILGDIVDHGRWKFRVDYAASYTAVFTLSQKVVAGIGASAGLLLLGFFGYDATGSAQSGDATFGMKLVVAWLPAFGLLLLAPLLWRFPLTREQHSRMVADIEARA